MSLHLLLLKSLMPKCTNGPLISVCNYFNQTKNDITSPLCASSCQKPETVFRFWVDKGSTVQILNLICEAVDSNPPPKTFNCSWLATKLTNLFFIGISFRGSSSNCVNKTCHNALVWTHPRTVRPDGEIIFQYLAIYNSGTLLIRYNKIAKVGSKILAFHTWHRILKFCQSATILPKLVTLPLNVVVRKTRQLPIRKFENSNWPNVFNCHYRIYEGARPWCSTICIKQTWPKKLLRQDLNLWKCFDAFAWSDNLQTFCLSTVANLINNLHS